MTEVYDGSQDLDSTVVRFTADWCGPCKTFAPLFERAADHAGETWLVVDVDEYPEVAKGYGVMSIPAVFEHGERVEAHTTWARERLNSD